MPRRFTGTGPPRHHQYQQRDLTAVVRRHSNGWFSLWFEYNEDLVEAIKGSIRAPFRKWVPEDKRWEFIDRELDTVKTLLATFDYDLEIQQTDCPICFKPVDILAQHLADGTCVDHYRASQQVDPKPYRQVSLE